MDETVVTCTDAEQALLRAVKDAAEVGSPDGARDLAQALLFLRQAQATEKAAVVAAAGERPWESFRETVKAFRESR